MGLGQSPEPSSYPRAVYQMWQMRKTAWNAVLHTDILTSPWGPIPCVGGVAPECECETVVPSDSMIGRVWEHCYRGWMHQRRGSEFPKCFWQTHLSPSWFSTSSLEPMPYRQHHCRTGQITEAKTLSFSFLPSGYIWINVWRPHTNLCSYQLQRN